MTEPPTNDGITDDEIEAMAEAIVDGLRYEHPDMLMGRIRLLGFNAKLAGKPLSIGELTKAIREGNERPPHQPKPIDVLRSLPAFAEQAERERQQPKKPGPVTAALLSLSAFERERKRYGMPKKPRSKPKKKP
jgi:hypothetical protein